MKDQYIVCIAVLLMIAAVATYKTNDLRTEMKESPLDIDSTIITEKYNMYKELEKGLLFIKEMNSEDEGYQENLTQLFGEQIEGNKHASFGGSGSDLNFYFQLNEFLSKSNIPDYIESAGIGGIKEFIVHSEESFKTLQEGDEESWRSAHYSKYDPALKAVFAYTVSAPPPFERPNYTSFYVDFRQTISYPDDYMELIKGIESEQNYFSKYFVGGNKDMLVFENSQFIQYAVDEIGRRPEKDEKIPEYPLKAWLYGKDGTIDSVTLAYIKPRQALFEDVDVESMVAYLDVLRLSEEDKTTIKSQVLNALEQTGKDVSGQVSGHSYKIHTTSDNGYYEFSNKIVELTVQ